MVPLQHLPSIHSWQVGFYPGPWQVSLESSLRVNALIGVPLKYAHGPPSSLCALSCWIVIRCWAHISEGLWRVGFAALPWGVHGWRCDAFVAQSRTSSLTSPAPGWLGL